MAKRKKKPTKSCPQQEQTHEEFEREVMERRAQGAAAWGMCGAYMRQATLDRELATYDREIKRAGSDEERRKIEKEKNKVLDKAKSVAGVLRIGPY